MKYWPLIWSGIWRKPGRTALMLLQILVAFVLFGVLQGVKSGIDQALADIRAQVYWVYPADAGTKLPIGMEQRIAAIPGVKHIYPITFVGSSYQRPNQQMIILPTDFDAGWGGNLNAQASPEAIAALAHSRTGALVSAGLQAQYHWKIGEQIPLLTRIPQTDGNETWTFQDLGTFRGPDSGSLDHYIIVRDDYFQQARQNDQNTVQQFVIDVADAAQGEQIARRIDTLFANSSFPTRTQSTRATSQNNYRRLGDINFIVHATVSAALVALLIATAALTMQSVRERTTELAVLETLGFSDRKVLVLLLLESIVLSVGAALVGLIVASRLMLWVNRLLGVRVSMPYEVVAVGLVLALVLALASAGPPAWRVRRLQVADALAGR